MRMMARITTRKVKTRMVGMMKCAIYFFEKNAFSLNGTPNAFRSTCNTRKSSSSEKRVQKRLPSELSSPFCRTSDTNKDGVLDFDEFKALLKEEGPIFFCFLVVCFPSRRDHFPYFSIFFFEMFHCRRA